LLPSGGPGFGAFARYERRGASIFHVRVAHARVAAPAVVRAVACTIAAMFRRTALPEGPRVISARMPGARSVSVAAYVLAGSRIERPGEAGVAHFMEHITFKGTASYGSSRAISEAIEGVGGSFNAATDRESTVYWVRVPRRAA
jgi:predicted Zn-dependent peptidase